MRHGGGGECMEGAPDAARLRHTGQGTPRVRMAPGPDSRTGPSAARTSRSLFRVSGGGSAQAVRHARDARARISGFSMIRPRWFSTVAWIMARPMSPPETYRLRKGASTRKTGRSSSGVVVDEHRACSGRGSACVAIARFVCPLSIFSVRQRCRPAFGKTPS